MRFCALLTILYFIYPVECANILFVTTFSSYSHQRVFQPIWRELSLRGHKVTVLTANPMKEKSLSNLTEIDLSFLYKLQKKPPDYFKDYSFRKPGFLGVFIKDFVANYLFSENHAKILENANVQKLIHGENKYDVVIAEWLLPIGGAFAAKFRCPLVGITSLGAPVPSLDSVGNPSHPVFSPDYNLPIGKELSFGDRVLSTLFSVYTRLHHQWVLLPREDKIVKKYFGDDMPYLGDIQRNISILLLNRNPVFHRVMPLVPAVIELGSVQSYQKPEPLNDELRTFLDQSNNGVVYLSFGSTILSEDLPDSLREIFLKTFTEIPYNVVWKWEGKELTGKPKNVFTQKWIPQAELLNHPNVKVFITQGGLQSIQETIKSHVPIIGIPAHSDQTYNVDTAVHFGFGIEIDYEYLSVDTLKEGINKIMTNGSYKENTFKIDKLMRDRPIDGLKRAIWWIEYVIRHKGAKHLRSPSLDIPWYQYLLLDVFAVVGVVLFSSFYIVYKLLQLLMRVLKKLLRKIFKMKND